MIVAAYSGTGKTTLAKLYPQMVIDFVCMPYKYQLNKSNKYNESCKANPNNILQYEWPFNYFDAIKQNLNDDKIILIPSDLYILSLLSIEKIPYTLCYPQRNAKEIYLRRFIERGNSEKFIEIFIDGWDEFLDILEKDQYGKHITMRPNQFLSDVIDVRPFLTDRNLEPNYSALKKTLDHTVATKKILQ